MSLISKSSFALCLRFNLTPEYIGNIGIDETIITSGFPRLFTGNRKTLNIKTNIL